MKNWALIATTIIAALSSGCGPSQREKETIARLTCNVIGESRGFESAFRIQEINAAREEIGESPFFGSDRDIRRSIEYSLCRALVLNDPNYEQKMSEAVTRRSEILREIRLE